MTTMLGTKRAANLKDTTAAMARGKVAVASRRTGSALLSASDTSCWPSRSPPLATIEIDVLMQFENVSPHSLALATS